MSMAAKWKINFRYWWSEWVASHGEVTVEDVIAVVDEIVKEQRAKAAKYAGKID